MTVLLHSKPRSAGRQCMNRACGPADTVGSERMRSDENARSDEAAENGQSERAIPTGDPTRRRKRADLLRGGVLQMRRARTQAVKKRWSGAELGGSAAPAATMMAWSTLKSLNFFLRSSNWDFCPMDAQTSAPKITILICVEIYRKYIRFVSEKCFILGCIWQVGGP